MWLNAVDLAEFLSELDRESAVQLFRMLPKEAAASVFAELPAKVQQWIVHAATDAELSEIVNDLFVDAVSLVIYFTIAGGKLLNLLPAVRPVCSSLFYVPLSQLKIPRCSRRIFRPIKIRTTPPKSSALDLYRMPKAFPSFTPAAESTKVVIPIKITAGTI